MSRVEVERNKYERKKINVVITEFYFKLVFNSMLIVNNAEAIAVSNGVAEAIAIPASPFFTSTGYI